MRFLVILIIILSIPYSLMAQEIVPSGLLPTGELDSRNVLKNSKYQLELKPIRPEEKGTQEDNKIEVLTPSERTLFNTQGYNISSSFLYDSHNSQRETYEGGMTFQISNSHINFNTISGATTQVKTVTLSTSADAPFGYRIILIQEKPLSSKNGTFISPTICSSSTPCSEKQAQPWTNRNMYGWGYSVAGDGIPKDFKSKEHYRSLKQSTTALLAQKTQVIGRSNTQLSLKINTPQNTPEGIYTMIWKLFAIPIQ